MSTVISIELGAEPLERLHRVACAMNRAPGEAAAVLVEEGLRLRQSPGLESRKTALGRQNHLPGTRLAVWQVALVARDYGGEAATTHHLDINREEAMLALAHARTYAAEVEAAIRDNEAAGERLAATLPLPQVVEV